MFDVQALWSLHYIAGKISLPDRTTMEEHMQQWINRLETLEKIDKNLRVDVELQTCAIFFA
jgi:hypothetical protein